MTAHLSGDQIERYLARTLPPADILALHMHLETCDGCRAALEQAALVHADPVGAPLLWDKTDDGDLHLSEDEMVGFVSSRLPGPRRAEAARHLEKCEICQDSVSVMKGERDRAATVPRDRSGKRWLYVAAGLAAALLIAVAIRYGTGNPARAPVPAPIASLRDSGQTIALDASGTLSGLGDASPDERALVREALRQRSLPAGNGISAEKPGVLLTPDAGGKTSFAPIGPLNTRVLSDRPVFTWSPYPGATDYQVLVTNEMLDPVARSERITATQWQPTTALPRGVNLLWQIRAWQGGAMVSAPAPPAPPAKFGIVSAETANRLERLRSEPHASHLLMAVICAREGLRSEAADEIRKLAQENPDSALVRSLEASSPGQ